LRIEFTQPIEDALQRIELLESSRLGKSKVLAMFGRVYFKTLKKLEAAIQDVEGAAESLWRKVDGLPNEN